ncbi:MAG: hypothetical protein J0L92_28190 [Deltaproteobacteria bacterium]|nr:hypothetical protein [Deltaproteobacteria bacterium]
MRTLRHAFTALAMTFLGGCAQPTELVLVIDAEPRLTVGRVVVDVFGSGRGQRAETIVGTDGAPRLPLTLGVVPQRAGVSDVTFQVAATVRVGDEGADATLQRVVRTSFLPGSSRMIRVSLSASCIGHACGDDQSCDLEGCVPIEVSPETLPSWSGSPPSNDPRRCADHEEACNGFDDDCDDAIDEGIDFASSSEDCGRCGRSCNSGNCDAGLCAEDRVGVLAAGGAHACVVRANQTIACWGANHERQTSALGVVARSVPTTQAEIGFEDVTAGIDHTCAVDIDQRVACVGNGTTGALGTGTVDQSVLETLVATSAPVVEIDAGAGFTTAISNGHVLVWGTFEGATTSMPRELPHVGAFTDVAAGTRHLCGLLGDGTVACTGDNDRGQLGQGDMMPYAGLQIVPGLAMVTRLAAGRDVTCALRMDGSVWCWGANELGQLGTTDGDRAVPMAVPGLGAAASVDVARAGMHACAALRDGTLVCWGDNSSGALGDGTVMARPGLVAVPGLRDVASVACGGLGAATGFTCALMASGAVACWGADDLGQTGDGEASFSPTLVPHWTIGAPPPA